MCAADNNHVHMIPLLLKARFSLQFLTLDQWRREVGGFPVLNDPVCFVEPLIPAQTTAV